MSIDYEDVTKWALISLLLVYNGQYAIVVVWALRHLSIYRY